jgi:hypothetical protein
VPAVQGTAGRLALRGGDGMRSRSRSRDDPTLLRTHTPHRSPVPSPRVPPPGRAAAGPRSPHACSHPCPSVPSSGHGAPSAVPRSEGAMVRVLTIAWCTLRQRGGLWGGSACCTLTDSAQRRNPSWSHAAAACRAGPPGVPPKCPASCGTSRLCQGSWRRPRRHDIRRSDPFVSRLWTRVHVDGRRTGVFRLARLAEPP